MLSEQHRCPNVQPKSSIVCVSEKKAQYCIENNKPPIEIKCYKVDGGLISDLEAKCDYLMVVEDYNAYVFVELKGSDVIHAVEQLSRSYRLLKGGQTTKHFFRISRSGSGRNVPDMRATPGYKALAQIAPDRKVAVFKSSDKPETVSNFQ